MKPVTRYIPTDEGFAINGSNEIFNRTLYGSHSNDNNDDRFFTFAGDAPLFMGAITDYTNRSSLVTYYEKCGVLASGLAITPGRRSRFYYTEEIDQTSRWFHNSEDIRAEYKNGWMEYDLSQISAWFPDVRIKMEAYPLLPEDGYLVHYHIETDQHVYFTAGFGGITEDFCQARYEYRGESRRYFTADNVKGNTVTIGKNRATVKGVEGKTMHIATSFPANFEKGSAAAMATPYVSTFLGSSPENEDDQVVKISAPIEAGQVLEGYIVAVYNADEKALDKWLTMENPIGYLKSRIIEKFACVDVTTPQKTIDLTVNPTVIALDAAFHKDTFYHGAFAYHAPFLGWRNWYAATALGWRERVEKATRKWLGWIKKGDVADEKVWYDYSVIPPEKNRFDGRWHHQDNPVGRIPSHFGAPDQPTYGPYNMQECGLDMMLYNIEWTGDMKLAEDSFDDMCSMVEWETRTFDPNGTGLYQSVLNTWISDGHNYNGAGCAQSSAYNYRANLVLSKIAEKIGRDGSKYAERAEKIKKALNEKLWLPNDGIIAEYLDTVGNCLIHPAVELPSIYHVIDSDMVDDFRAYKMLRYSEKHIKNIETPGIGGRLCYSSNWLPKQYSNCGIFPAENAHLALMYFKLGLKEEGKKILDGIADCYFTGKNPGMAPHVQSQRGTGDLGDLDFTDVSSTYLRLVMEGLFGIRIDALEGYVYIQPGFPNDWEEASITLSDIGLSYKRKGNQEIFDISCDRKETKQIRIPMRSADIDFVMLDGELVDYKIVAGANNSFVIVETEKQGRFNLRVMHGGKALPKVDCPKAVLAGNKFVIDVADGEIVDTFDVSETLESIKVVGNKIYAKTKEIAGDHTLFIRVKSGEFDAWLAADYDIENEAEAIAPLEAKPFETVDMSSLFNCSMTALHDQAYIEPRPKAYSMGLFQNGRYSHNWNQYGRNVVYVDDSMLRNAGGKITTPSGIAFATPEKDDNIAIVTMFEAFPTEINVPLSGKGQEIAVMYVASANCMLSYVENARITVTYKDGTTSEKSLVYPLNVDDWLTSALTTDAECFYFSDFNHATVQRIRIDADKELESVKIEAICNDVIIGVAGISIARN